MESQLTEFEQRLASADTDLQEARKVAEHSLLELHQQVQEEREQYILADGEKQIQLEARNLELSELQLTQAAQVSAHELELKALRELLESQLTEFEQRLASADTDLQDAKKAAQHSLLELHQQVQEEREQYVLADVMNQRQLEARDRELSELLRTQASQESAHELELKALRELLESQLAELAQRLASSNTELRQVREADELSMVQFHQVQEELAHYLLVDGEKQRQIEASAQELEQLRLTKSAQERSHELELKALRELFESQFAELEQRLVSRDMELREAREAAELSMLQLHQVQEDLEQYFFIDGEKQLKLEARERELEELRRSRAVQETALVQELQTSLEHLELRLVELEHRLASKEIELQEVTEAAELSLLQLHQVQEELENYFLKSRASEQLAQAQFEQLQRAQGLMLRLHPDVLPNGPYPTSLPVQVLPELAAATPNPTLQAEALLNTYAASLQRASALLERARRP